MTLLEVAGMLLIAGIMLQAVLTGEAMIRTARVDGVIAQQRAAEAAVMAFQDRFQAWPGDYANAAATITCPGGPCLNGDGNGRIEAGNAAGLREDILAWTHLSAAGFLQNRFEMMSGLVTVASPDTVPSGTFGAYMQIASDAAWGFSGNISIRPNIKTGDMIPVDVLAEVDRKTDDGLPGAGRFQFSRYVADSAPLPAGGGARSCTDADSASAHWNLEAGPTDCGGATILR